MPITIAHLKDQLAAYLERWPGDAESVAPLLALDGPEGFDRTTMPGHVTASAILVNDRDEVLLVHHRGLDRWLQPGGHVEPGDDSLPAAAMREAVEETGIAPAALELAEPVPIHVDVHRIPANPRKDEGAHWHYDVRYRFRCGAHELSPQAEEVHAAEWRPAADLDSVELAERLTARTSYL
ncbi:NUDIX hydrolase [Glycomyces sp. TRM65418]|uniref:NUDIX hydrolase n=1 Tax=Glycomyces sp. TRM65418 TaxID=2867006 RepID=UPI001CE63038|nr:NUDIX hydrolase [Glycomyces sp. TRM65418]MCC3765530.1 NUDIX hydrolase [Glycomyces sp. TRM65418]QZD55137.1 NUDIX hydrolase [Glycomyces sp. TRM65418]